MLRYTENTCPAQFDSIRFSSILLTNIHTKNYTFQLCSTSLKPKPSICNNFTHGWSRTEREKVQNVSQKIHWQ